ncbi:TPA: hypothetical protein EYO12_02820 [Candidatus Saccharibacteria bacterium]|nr:hypothetical protein [Candidatus Saccharibacteria bacterium]HIO88028.1 hypothetical protein [Candidatus Saccharibacteria bacterium]
MELAFLRKSQEAESIWSFYFTKPPALQFEAGDYVDVEIETSSVLGDRRWLTISSSPTADHIRFSLKVPVSTSEFKRALMNLKKDDTIQVSPPIGTFHLPRRKDAPIVWVAGGIGITPFLSQSQWLIDTNQNRTIECLYVAKPNEHVFVDQLVKVSELTTTTERPAQLDHLYTNLVNKQIFLSGPQPFCMHYYDQLQKMGLSRQQLHLDYFPGYQTI